MSGLAPGVEGARDLRATERPVVQQAAVLTGEGHALRGALVDDVHRLLGEAVHVCLARPEVAALHRVVEEAVDRIAVALVVLGGVDATLRGDRVGAAWRVVEGEGLHLVALLAQGGSGGTAGEAGADDDHLVLATVRRVHELALELVVGPLVGDGAGGNLGVQLHGGPQFPTMPAMMAIGIATFPMTVIAANPAAKFRRHELNRGLFQPSDWNRLHAPWKRWRPRARLA